MIVMVSPTNYRSMNAKVKETAPLQDVHIINVKGTRRIANVCPMDQESALSVLFKPTWTNLAELALAIATVTLQSDPRRLVTPLDPTVAIVMVPPTNYRSMSVKVNITVPRLGVHLHVKGTRHTVNVCPTEQESVLFALITINH